MRARRSAICCAALLAASCVSPLEQGEQLYREGDQHAALETWESIPRHSTEYGQAQEKIDELELERAQLVDRYTRRARYYERHKRLAESLLNYRLALRLKYNEPTMAHVQELARILVNAKEQYWQAFDEAFEAQELAQARDVLKILETYDPFDPQLTLKKSLLNEAFTARVEEILSRGRRAYHEDAYDRAETAFREVLELDPDNESAQGYLSFVEELQRPDQGNGKQAPSSRKKRRATDAQIRAEGLYQIALASERVNDPYKAITYDELALTADPKHENARKHLARLRRELTPEIEELVEQGRTAFGEEDLQAALDFWKKALKINPEDERVKGYIQRAENLLQELERLRATPLPEVSAQ